MGVNASSGFISRQSVHTRTTLRIRSESLPWRPLLLSEHVSYAACTAEGCPWCLEFEEQLEELRQRLAAARAPRARPAAPCHPATGCPSQAPAPRASSAAVSWCSCARAWSALTTRTTRASELRAGQQPLTVRAQACRRGGMPALLDDPQV